jgi:cation transport ATPase
MITAKQNKTTQEDTPCFMNLAVVFFLVKVGCCVVVGAKQVREKISTVQRQPGGQYSRRVQRLALLGAFGALGLVFAAKYGVADQLGYPEYAWLLPVVAIVCTAILPLRQALQWIATGQAQAGAISFLLAAGAAVMGRFEDAALLLSMWTLTAVMRARIYELVSLPLASWQVLAQGEWPTRKSVVKQLQQLQRTAASSKVGSVEPTAAITKALDDGMANAAEAAAVLDQSDATSESTIEDETVADTTEVNPIMEQDSEEAQDSMPESITIATGEIVPCDGIVLGEGALVSTLWDNQLATTKDVGEKVYAGDINLGSTLTIQPTSTVDNSALASAVRLGQNSMAPLWQRSATGRTLRAWSMWWSLAAVVVAAGAPFVLGVTVNQALYKGMALLALTLPGAWVAALELPVVATNGAVFRRRYVPMVGWVVSQMSKLGFIVLAWDATFGRVRRYVADVQPLKPKACSAMELLALAAAVESASGGMDGIAAAICTAAQNERLSLPSATDGRRIANEGASAVVEGHMCHVGNARYMQSQGIDTSVATGIVKKLKEQDCRPVFCAAGGYLLGAVGISEPQRQTWPSVSDQLRRLAVKIVVVNGNANDGRNAWAPGHPEGTVSLLMGQEIPTIRSWKNKQSSVGVVGDSLYDQDILNQADVGIALGPVWLDNPAGHLVLMHHDLSDLPWLIRLGKSLRRRTCLLNVLCMLVRLASLALIVVSGVGAVEIVAIDMLAYTLVAVVSLQLLGREPIPMPHQLQTAHNGRRRKH